LQLAHVEFERLDLAAQYAPTAKKARMFSDNPAVDPGARVWVPPVAAKRRA